MSKFVLVLERCPRSIVQIRVCLDIPRGSLQFRRNCVGFSKITFLLILVPLERSHRFLYFPFFLIISADHVCELGFKCLKTKIIKSTQKV